MSVGGKPRLDAATRRGLPATVQQPAYDPGAVRVGWAHLGAGAFHRAHQAEFADDLLAAGHLGWGIAAINLRPPDITAALTPQQGLYLRLARDAAGEAPRLLGAIREALFLEGRGAEAARRLADPAVRLVTLTVTEKGYCHVPATGALREDHPDILHDRAHPDDPVSAPGVLVAALAARRAAGASAPTLLSCDNVAGNGAVLRASVLGLARARDAALAGWIERHAAFPSCMVDRIVPATSEEDRTTARDAFAVDDAALVTCEPFRQWVIEDRFAGEMPPLSEAGALIVPDVAPYEAMKMRLLNGCQSALACLGLLAGCAHTSDVMARPAFAAYAEALMREETAPTLPPLPGIDLGAYRATVLRRLRNPAIRHRTAQIASDSSQKIPQRLLAPLRWHLARDRPAPMLALAVAAFIQYATGRHLDGRALEVIDPLAGRLRDVADTAGPALVPAMLGVADVFGDDLAASPLAVSGIEQALRALRRLGAEAAARALLAGAPQNG